jgi:hypothetical protein
MSASGEMIDEYQGVYSRGFCRAIAEGLLRTNLCDVALCFRITTIAESTSWAVMGREWDSDEALEITLPEGTDFMALGTLRVAESVDLHVRLLCHSQEERRGQNYFFHAADEYAYDLPLLKYDAWNRLVRVDLGPLNPYATFEYDGLGQRIVQVNNGTPNNGAFDYYYNDQWQLLTEVIDGSVEAIYHWHPHYVDALGVRMRASDTHFFLQDANFNVTAAVNDDGNAVVERYGYTPRETAGQNDLINRSDQRSDPEADRLLKWC